MKIHRTGTNPFLQLLVRSIIFTLINQTCILIAETVGNFHYLFLNMRLQ